MKKLILKSEIRKMGLSSEELLWSDHLQDVDYSRLYFAYDYTGSIECIPSMYRKAVAYFAKECIKSTNGTQTSFNATCIYVADKLGACISGVSRTLKGISASSKEFIISETLGLDCITLKD